MLAALLLTALATASSAEASPILWTLNQVTFDDGGTASGSFVFDAETSVYSGIDITTTAGTVMSSGATYQDEHPFYSGLSGARFLVMLDALPATFGTRALQLPFVSELTDLGQTVALGGLFNFGEGTCGATPCQDVSADLPMRRIVSGEVYGTPASVAAVPEPATLLLLGMGLSATAVCSRSRRNWRSNQRSHSPHH
jgi:hypothetical protein